MRFATLFIIILAASFPAFAGTIRHDRDPQQYLDLAQSSQFASAGLLRITRNEPGFTGSGVLVGDRWVLTAGHLLEGTRDMTFEVGGQSYAAQGWVAHRRFDGDLRKGYDIGLIRLAQPVSGIPPAVLNRSRREQGLLTTLVGFGRTGDGINGGQPLDQVDFLARAGTNVVDGTVDLKLGFGNYRPKLTGRVFVTDFDNPTNPADNVTGTPDAADLEFLIAQGDSGGPAFIDLGLGDGPVLAGIHSFGEFDDERDDSDYGDVTGHTRVSFHRSWVTKTIRRGDLGRVIPDFINASSATPMELGPVMTLLLPEPSIGLALVPAVFASRRRRPVARVSNP